MALFNCIFFLAFFATLCFAGIVIKPIEPDKSGLVEATAQILKSCYGNLRTSVGVAGNSTDVIAEILKSGEICSITNIDADARVVDNGGGGPVLSENRYKLQVFVVTASSSATLTRTLRQIKASLWWNHMAAFLIVDWSAPSDRGCSNASEMLWAAWEMNILNAKLICHNRASKRLLIHTFNPYTIQAPQPWQFDKAYSGKNNHPWALFTRSYTGDRTICSELDFEKTNDLGGYEVRVSLTAATFGFDTTKTADTSCFYPFADIFCQIIFPALNATPKVLVHSSENDVGYIDKNGNISGILREVTEGLSDIGATTRFVTSLSNLTATYPHWVSGLHSLTQFRGYKSQLSKLKSVIDSYSRWGLYLVLLITILFFKFFVRQSLTVALLNTVRIISDSSLVRMPRNVPPRIYLGALFIFAVTMQGIYRGQLASLLTRREPLRNVDTMKDLTELGHTIYGYVSNALFFNNPELENRYVGLTNRTCTNYVLSDPQAACVRNKVALLQEALKYNLYLSRYRLTSISEALPIRPDWPLEERVNTIILRSVAAHQPIYLRDKVIDKAQRLLHIQENKHKDHRPKVLTLEQLSFAFAILGIGLGCATITFVFEVGLDRMRNYVLRQAAR